MMLRLLLCLGCVMLLSSSTCKAQYIVAHRGASFDAPENTLAAFQLAWEQGADAIEGDFYLTRDLQIVCLHDKHTERVAPQQNTLQVASSTLEELRSLEVGSWKDPKYLGEKIPTLAEVLSIVPEGKRIFVEVKCGPEIIPHLKTCLESSRLKPEQVIIIAFDAKVIQGARTNMPQFQANWLAGFKQDKSTKVLSPEFSEILEALKSSQASGLGIQGNRAMLDQQAVGSVLNAGFEFHVWTINEPEDARYFASLGAHSITTDKPQVIRQSLAEAQPRN